MFDPPEIALAALSDFIAAGVEGLTVINEWPYGNEPLKYPSMTITVQKPKRTPMMPYDDSQTQPDQNNKIIVNEVVAEWDFSLQLDLWCADKSQRKEITEKVLLLFQSQPVDGLSLTLDDMFGSIARYEIDTVEPVDDEAAAQRQERREKIMVISNFFEIRQKSYYAIRKTEIHTQVATDISGPGGIEISEDFS